MAEVAKPLDLLDVLARRHACSIGVVATARGEGRLRQARVEALEVRAGSGFWPKRELVARACPGSALGARRDLPLQEAASELIESLGAQGWLDEDSAA